MTARLHLKRPGRGVRRTQGVMNGLERDYAQLLSCRQQAGEVLAYWFDAIKLRLADTTFYTPDFLVMLADGTLEVHETKGFMESDAAVKLKVAAALFPFVFRLVQRKRKSDPWTITEVGSSEAISSEVAT